MLTKINNWFISLPESAQSYFINLLILNLSIFDFIPIEFKTNEKKGKFLKGYLNEVNLTTAEELKRFLLAYSVIDIIIQTKRDYNFASDQDMANKILKLVNEVPNSKFRPILENSASGINQQIWHNVISSWDSLKVSQEMSFININERFSIDKA
jgi:hypothetical protein